MATGHIAQMFSVFQHNLYQTTTTPRLLLGKLNPPRQASRRERVLVVVVVVVVGHGTMSGEIRLSMYITTTMDGWSVRILHIHICRVELETTTTHRQNGRLSPLSLHGLAFAN